MQKSGEECPGQKAQSVQRPRGYTMPCEAESEQGDPCGWSGMSKGEGVGDKGEEVNGAKLGMDAVYQQSPAGF